MELDGVNLLFKNNDLVTISNEDIKSLVLSDVVSDIRKITEDEISSNYIVNNFAIRIGKEGDKSFWDLSAMYEDSKTIFKRIYYHPDIVCVELIIKGIEYPYYVKWNESNNEINLYQNSCVDKTGDLFIVISKTDTIGDYFSLKY